MDGLGTHNCSQKRGNGVLSGSNRGVPGPSFRGIICLQVVV